MTYIDTETSDWQLVPEGRRTTLQVGAPGIVSIPSAHPNPSGGFFLEVAHQRRTVYRDAETGEISGIGEDFGSTPPLIIPTLIEYNLTNKTNVVIEEFDPLQVHVIAGNSTSSWRLSHLVGRIPPPRTSGFDYRMRFFVTYPRESHFKLRLRGLTQQ